MSTPELDKLLRDYAARLADPASDPATLERRVAHIVAMSESELRLQADYEWGLKDPGVQDCYGGRVVAVHQRRVWGAGNTHAEALDAALRQPACPPRESLALVPLVQRRAETASDQRG
jgi:hypothetical protein